MAKDMSHRNTYRTHNNHTIGDKSYSLNQRHHCFGYSSQLDYNGSGLYGSTTANKVNERANYYPIHPSLPFFVDKCRQEYTFAAKDCLISATIGHKDWLLWSTRHAINGLPLETNSDGNKRHLFSTDSSVTCGPFRRCCSGSGISDDNNYNHKLFDFEDQYMKPIFEMKICQDLDELQTNSRHKITFFRFNEDNEDESSITLNVLNELTVESMATNDKEWAFDCCDRNQLIDNELIISYTTDDVMNLYDLEANRKITEISLNSLDDKQIGVQWSHYDPNVFIYGQNHQLVAYDTRDDSPALKLIDSKHNENQYKWEVFYKFLPSKLNANQVFVATDYHIFIIDCRFPNRNLIQLNHMLPKIIKQNLKSLVVDCDGESTEILVASNLKHNCLMSFKTVADLTALSSLYLPLHPSVPIDISRQFDDYLYRGIHLMDSGDKSGFSLSLLTQMGDIFTQDFYWNSFDDMNGRLDDGQYRDKTMASGVGSAKVMYTKETEDYMNAINEYLDGLQFERTVELSHKGHCWTCGDKRVNKLCQVMAGECQCRRLVPSVAETTHSDSDVEVEEWFNTECLETPVLDYNNKFKDLDFVDKTTDKLTKSLEQLVDQCHRPQQQTNSHLSQTQSQ